MRPLFQSGRDSANEPNTFLAGEPNQRMNMCAIGLNWSPRARLGRQHNSNRHSGDEPNSNLCTRCRPLRPGVGALTALAFVLIIGVLLAVFQNLATHDVPKTSTVTSHRPCPTLGSLPDKSIARAVNCAEMHRICRIFFQLLPEPEYVSIHGSCGRIVAISPHLA
jgi:hypothetical protein